MKQKPIRVEDTAYFGESLRALRDREVGRAWPLCLTCRGPAEIVCVSPEWCSEGFPGGASGPRAKFVCRRHAAEPTTLWYWFWIIDANLRDDECMTLWERDSMAHIAEKSWGPSFLGWLLRAYDLSSYAERASR